MADTYCVGRGHAPDASVIRDIASVGRVGPTYRGSRRSDSRRDAGDAAFRCLAGAVATLRPSRKSHIPHAVRQSVLPILHTRFGRGVIADCLWFEPEQGAAAAPG